MVDEVKTLREASREFASIGTRLNLMTGVFVAVVAIAGTAYWNTDGKLTKLGDAVSAIQTSSAVQAEQLKTVNRTLDEIRVALTARGESQPPGVAPQDPGRQTRNEADGPRLALFGLGHDLLVLVFKKASPPEDVTFYVSTPNKTLRAAWA